MPESVNWRGSSGPTIGAIVRCSSAVAMPSEVTGAGLAHLALIRGLGSFRCGYGRARAGDRGPSPHSHLQPAHELAQGPAGSVAPTTGTRSGRSPKVRRGCAAYPPATAPCAGRSACACCGLRARRRAFRTPPPRPSSMNTTVSATSRANPISWVTTIIVIPSRASWRIASSTSPTSSGSSAEVGSSNSISLGSHGQRAGDRHALLLAAGEGDRVDVELVGQADPVEQRLGPRSRASSRGTPQHPDRRQRDVLQRGHVREQVEVLEHHPDLGPLAGDLALVSSCSLPPASR